MFVSDKLKNYLAKQGIEYVLILTADKFSIYPEYIFGQTDIEAYLWQSDLFRQKYRSDPDIPTQGIQGSRSRYSGQTNWSY